MYVCSAGMIYVKSTVYRGNITFGGSDNMGISSTRSCAINVLAFKIRKIAQFGEPENQKSDGLTNTNN